MLYEVSVQQREISDTTTVLTIMFDQYRRSHHAYTAEEIATLLDHVVTSPNPPRETAPRWSPCGTDRPAPITTTVNPSTHPPTSESPSIPTRVGAR
ncbi:hypothetical protein GCM10027444_08700 [Actinopolyspora lacussalsi]